MYPNKTIENLLSRTCCRQFKNKIVPNKLINWILRAGQAAPSAKNRQPWFFLVIKNKTCLNEISQEAFWGRQKQHANLGQKAKEMLIKGQSCTSANDAVLAGADFAILVFRDSDRNYQEADPLNFNLKEEQSVACACINMMNAAFSLGIGMCWNCSILYFEKELKIVLKKYGFNLPPNLKARAILPAGYPKGKLTKPQRKNIKEIIRLIK